MRTSKIKLSSPINPVEKRILKDKEFLLAIMVGRPRFGHSEGTLKKHIIHILNYIESNYKDTKFYDDLRMLAFLHDTGKFAHTEERKAEYLPKLPKDKIKLFISKSRSFKRKYYQLEKIPTEVRKYKLTASHAYASYQFAKKFIKNKRLLALIKYHDIGYDFLVEYLNEGKYNERLFKKIYNHIDIKTYLQFLKCDNCIRKDVVSKNLKRELKRHKIKFD